MNKKTDTLYTVNRARHEFCLALMRLRSQQEFFVDPENAIHGGTPGWVLYDLVKANRRPSTILEMLTDPAEMLLGFDVREMTFYQFVEECARQNKHEEDSPAKTEQEYILGGWHWWVTKETEKQFREKMKASFDLNLENYIAYAKREIEAQRFKKEHFEWLVRRTVKPIETQEAIAGDYQTKKSGGAFTAKEIRTETKRLAAFIGIDPPKK